MKISSFLLGSRLSKMWIVILALITSVAMTAPLSRYGLKGVFFSTDPDIQYLSNSLSYIEKGQIQYASHPGTPTIIILSLALRPLQVYAELFTGTSFMTWVFENISFVYLYARIFQSVLLGAGMGVFLWAILKYTKSVAACLFAWSALFLFTAFFSLGISIIPDTTSFLITSIWLLIFSVSPRPFPKRNLLLLAGISGLALANKYTNITLVLLSLTLSGRWVKKIVLSLFTMVAAFVVSTWPLHKQYIRMFGSVMTLVSSTGVHGSGKKAFLDIETYRDSVQTLVHSNFWVVGFIILTALLLLGFLAFRKLTIRNELVMIMGWALVVMVVFAKYPLGYYQLVNYILIVFVASVLLFRVSKFLVLGLPLLLVSTVISNFNYHNQKNFLAMANTVKLEEYISLHPATKATLWEWGRAKDYSYLWARDWASGLFDKELAKYRPDLLSIESAAFDKVETSKNQFEDIFGVCWDKFYIQTILVDNFLAKHSDRDLVSYPLPGITGMSMIESSHCL